MSEEYADLKRQEKSACLTGLLIGFTIAFCLQGCAANQQQTQTSKSQAPQQMKQFVEVQVEQGSQIPQRIKSSDIKSAYKKHTSYKRC